MYICIYTHINSQYNTQGEKRLSRSASVNIFIPPSPLGIQTGRVSHVFA